MGFFRHFGLLLWKNFLLQMRHPWVTFFEIVIPCFFIVMIAGIRVAVKVTHYDNTTYFESFDIYHVPNITQKTFTILYAPDISPFDQVINEVKYRYEELNRQDKFPRTYDFQVLGFPNEDKLVESYLGNTGNVILGGVVFENSTDKEFKFKLRFQSSPAHQLGDGPPFKSWNTKNTFPQFSLPGPRQRDHNTGGQPGYYEEGFITLQHLVSMALLTIHQNKTLVDTDFNDYEVVGQRFPYPPYIDDGFLVALQFLFPIILMFSFIYTPCNLTKNIVLEKEKRLKESMKMMGLKEFMHWLAWFTKYLIWMIITVGIMTILLSVKLRDGVGILNKSDPSLVFVFFLLYGINTIAFSFLVSTIFSKANVAGVGTGVLFFLTFMPYFTASTRYLEISLAQKVLTGLLHNTNMAFGAIIIAMWEGNNVGIRWSNLSETASPDDNLTLLSVIVMFIVDTIIYFVITWYVSSVFPGEYGIPRKWYFPIQKSYWCPSNYSGDEIDGVVNNGFDLHSRDEIDLENRLNSSYFESEPKNMPKGIQIKGLSKTFDGGDTYAVKNLNLTTYSGQITALLGHNGAGKTTTMSILTGLFPPSSGTAIVNGFDIRSNIENIRNSLGICPQFDVLFDEMTVEEHLRFFCKLKNVTDPEVIENEITDMIELLALTDKRKAQARTLSGGMKRKLSVGIALIGGSKIVILDEPTSGMDVSARRFIWDLLLEVKEHRTILLSTHFMEEADVLGDRIAIMANGKLQCCGSPLFLKKKYGAGYHLTISKKRTDTDVTPITQLIQSHIPNGKLQTSGGTELAYSLPNEDSSRFEALFSDIEEGQHDLGIDSYGASITTMEEVFLKVGEYAEEGIKAINENKNGIIPPQNHSYIPMDSTDKSRNTARNTGASLLFQQFYGLIIKKIVYGWRNPFLTLSQFLLPVVFTVSSILIGKSAPKPGDSPALNLNLANFKSTRIPYFSNPETNSFSVYYSNLMDAQNKGEPVIASVHNLTDFAVNYLDDLSRKDLSFYALHQPIGAIFQKDNASKNATRLTALFNNQAFHSPGIAMAYLDSAIIKQAFNQSDFNLNIINHPMPRTANEIFNSMQYQSQEQFQTAQNLMFSMAFLAASFAILLVRERAIKGKHLQIVCGVRLYIFWTASYIVDFLTYIIPCCIVMLLYKAFDLEALSTPAQEGRLFLLFSVHGLAMLPFVYALSFLFDVPSTAYVRICIYNVILGIGTFLAVIITELPALDVVYISKPLNTIFSMFLPNYILGRSVYNLYNNQIGHEICTTARDIPIKQMNRTLHMSLLDFCDFVCTWAKPMTQDPMFKQIQPCCKDNDCVDPDTTFAWEKDYLSLKSPGIGQLLLWLCFQTILYWIIIILIEYNVFRSIRYLFSGSGNTNMGSTDSQRVEDLDEDVVNESKRLQFTEFDKLAEDNALIIKNLTKSYGSFCAVDNISYGVRKGECFGLLGVNGAGKTTTFKMITGDEPITSGDIFVNGFDVKNDIQIVQRQIGYCPQFDGLLDQLTGKETLTLFSRLRGIKEEDIPDLIVDLSRLLYFDMHIDKQVGKYSGGTKRKLSTAVALLGSPSVSFLDEPTTGVDPVARRCLWDALTKKLYEGSSIVLTSHSMEECEALCSRLIIMVNGKICCIGSPQHLKNKFGKGYTIQMKVSTTESRERTSSNLLNRQLSRQMSNQSQKRRHSSLDSNKVSQFVYQRQASEMITAQNTTDVKEFMKSAFPGCQLKAVHNNLLEYSIYDEKITWSQIFGRIERAKNRINIEDYSIGQTTLEQIFLTFARKQRESSD